MLVSMVRPQKIFQTLILLMPMRGGGRKGPGLQFDLNCSHRGVRRNQKLFCKFIFSSRQGPEPIFGTIESFHYLWKLKKQIGSDFTNLTLQSHLQRLFQLLKRRFKSTSSFLKGIWLGSVGLVHVIEPTCTHFYLSQSDF